MHARSERDGRVSRGERGRGEYNTYTEAEARDEGERAAAPNGEHRDIKRPVFGSDLYTYMCCDHRHSKAVVQTYLQR